MSNTTKLDADDIFLLYALTESAGALRKIEEVQRLAGLRHTRAPGVEVLENATVFEAIRMALQFSANVSKVFWPHQHAAARGERLRQSIGLDDNHPLASRNLRNHIEHLDERLDDWTAASPRPFLAIQLVTHADEEAGPNRDEVIAATVIVYDAPTNSVHLFGEAFSLSDLKADVLDVQEHISKALAIDSKDERNEPISTVRLNSSTCTPS